MITAKNNKKIKEVTELMKKSAARKERGLFVVEGIKMYREIPEGRLYKTYVSDSFFRDHKELVTPDYEIVSDEVFSSMSDTRTPQGILALVRMDEPLKLEGDAFFILDRIQDPGNLGTIMRTAEAAGISGVLMSRDTVDIYNPKVVRSTMGSIFRVPFKYTDDLSEDMKKLNSTVYAAHLNGLCDYCEPDYRKPTAFVIGNESSGISDEIAGEADELIRIPMKGQVESLNAAVAATVLSFELSRQRRN